MLSAPGKNPLVLTVLRTLYLGSTPVGPAPGVFEVGVVLVLTPLSPSDSGCKCDGFCTHCPPPVGVGSGLSPSPLAWWESDTKRDVDGPLPAPRPRAGPCSGSDNLRDHTSGRTLPNGVVSNEEHNEPTETSRTTYDRDPRLGTDRKPV